MKGGNAIQFSHEENDPLQEFLKIKDVAKLLNVSQAHVYSLIANRRLPAMNFEGARRIRKADLYRWIEQQAIQEE